MDFPDVKSNQGLLQSDLAGDPNQVQDARYDAKKPPLPRIIIPGFIWQFTNGAYTQRTISCSQ